MQKLVEIGKSIFEAEPIRIRLQSDPHLLLHMLSDYLRCSGIQGGENGFEKTFSIIFPVRDFASAIDARLTVPAEEYCGIRKLKRPHELANISFNPKRPVVAVVFNDYGNQTLGVYAFSGRERADIGSMLYFYSGCQLRDCKSQHSQEMKISWSTKGTNLLCLQACSNTDNFGLITIFNMDKSGRMRRIHTPSMPKCTWSTVTNHGTAECWSSDDTFWIPTYDEPSNLTKISILNDAVIITSMKDIPIIPRGLTAGCCGVWVNESTAFWLQKCREGGHHGHTLIRRQSLSIPHAHPDNKAIAITYGYVTSATLNVSNDNSLLVLLLYPGSLQYESDNKLRCYTVVNNIDESIWRYSTQGPEFKYGASCQLDMPWITKHYSSQIIMLASIDPISDSIKIMSTHDIFCYRGNRVYWPDDFNKPFQLQIMSQTDRYAIICESEDAVSFILMSKITNLTREFDWSYAFTPNVDASLVIPIGNWTNHIKGSRGSHFKCDLPLKIAVPFDAKPSARKRLRLWASKCDLSCRGDWLVKCDGCPSAGQSCHFCDEQRLRRQLEEYNQPKVLALHIC